MITFPLYENMIKDVKTKDLNLKQKKELVTALKTIDETGAELCYMLIKVYEMKNDTPESLKLPYCGIGSDKEVTFDLEKFPIKLKHILFKFVNIHVRT